MSIDPRDKAFIDAHLECEAKQTSRKGWLVWLVIAIASVIAVYAAMFDVLPDALRLVLVVAGGIGILLFIAFLSTKSFGRGYWNGPEMGWWWRP